MIETLIAIICGTVFVVATGFVLYCEYKIYKIEKVLFEKLIGKN